MSEIRRVRFDGASKASICAIRENVFIQEQGVPPELEYDGLDEAAVQVLAFVDGRAAGTGRVLDDGHIGRIAVLSEFRERGLGAAIVCALIDEAAAMGCRRVYLGSQLQATGFYQTLGFTPYGETFMDAGIPHLHMEKQLQAVK